MFPYLELLLNAETSFTSRSNLLPKLFGAEDDDEFELDKFDDEEEEEESKLQDRTSHPTNTCADHKGCASSIVANLTALT